MYFVAMQAPVALMAASRRQHGLVTRAQVLAAGWSDATAHRRVDRGEWQRMHPGVYRLGAVLPPSPEQVVLAGCLAVTPEAAASHRSAAWLWRLQGNPPAAVELTVARCHHPRLAGVVLHRARLSPSDRWLRHRGILVTNPLRTLVDLAGVLCPEELGRALDAGLSSGLVSRQAVHAELVRHRARSLKGAGVLGELLVERGYPAVPRSLLEARMLALIGAAGLPSPIAQVPVGPDAKYRADMAWPKARVLVEVDGFASHGTPLALAADLERQNLLVAQGWGIFRYTWWQVTRQEARVGTQLREALAPFLARC